MTYRELIKQEPRIADAKPRFKDGLLLCGNCGTPASASMSVAVGWIGCAPCITGRAASFDDGDLVLESKVHPGLVALIATVCRCDRQKKRAMSFCGRCYHRLPQQMQRDLYKRSGQGYEAAYDAAVKHLKGEKADV